MATNNIKTLDKCPYCKSSKIIKKGFRKKKYENVQIYYCAECDKKFTPQIHKNKTFPLKIILDSITLHNRLNTLEQAAIKVSDIYGIKVSPQNISNWIFDFKQYLPFMRMRDFISKKYSPKEAVVETRMFHGQIYDFKYHRAKTELILDEDFKHRKFFPLQEFLELIVAECPHQIFKQSSKRASEYKGLFNLEGVRITPKTNMAVKTAQLVIQAVTNNKLRHEILQDFMFTNDSVTVAVEVPILLAHDDYIHYNNMLGFDVPLSLDEEDVITGHIDIIQIRNGSIHLLDYKPSAKKVKPTDQLTIYALALSRLTGIRLFHFKCGWFDETNYYEFFPLHVVYKKKSKR